ncbi:hypothetical protein PYW07_005462 [Mythimna separata]|uniref:FP protein C-terminal domain-containing protein n=1 Tax=Mythimna separata TaxID=271217 RepID=A0AAD7YEI6_MYTSE|nr:hypothetical protein PYW07_005462 [Mythimna separata]
MDNESCNKTENAPQRNERTIRANKRQALSSPPKTTVTAEGVLSRDDIRVIVQEVMKTELSKFNDTMKSMLSKELQSINSKIDSMDNSMKFINSQYEDILKKLSTSEQTILVLQKENADIKSVTNSLKVRLDQLEQQTRSNNVEIQCLPEKKHEDLLKIVTDLSKAVGCDLENRDVLHCTRVAKLKPDNMRPRSIIVQLASPRLRDRFLASTITFNKANKENKLNSTHIGCPGPKTAIYVNEHLSPTYKALHAAARIKAKELGYKFVWVRSGRIFMRKVEESDHIMIKNMDTLNKLN